MKTDPPRTAVAKLPAVVDGSIHITKITQAGGPPIYQPAAVCKYSELRLQQRLIDVEPKLIPPASQTHTARLRRSSGQNTMTELSSQQRLSTHERHPIGGCCAKPSCKPATRRAATKMQSVMMLRGRSSRELCLLPPPPPSSRSVDTAAAITAAPHKRQHCGDGLAKWATKHPWRCPSHVPWRWGWAVQLLCDGRPPAHTATQAAAVRMQPGLIQLIRSPQSLDLDPGAAGAGCIACWAAGAPGHVHTMKLGRRAPLGGWV
jgi:hypothetical protein